MAKLVTDHKEATANIVRLNQVLPTNPQLADRLAHVHAFYPHTLKDGSVIFGFSKFIGYQGLTDQQYLRDYKKLNGLNTEHALSKWFDEVAIGSPAYKKLFIELCNWLDQFGKKPRGGKKQSARFMVLKPELEEQRHEGEQDRRLLDLMLAVADLLPTHQRHLLRSAL